MGDTRLVEITLGRTVEVATFGLDGGRETARITSAKSLGLLALLALAPNGTRSRKWLQSVLWSDRSDQQASGSLRQEVRNLSVSVPALREAIVSARTTVTLVPERVALSEERGSGPAATAFLEELVVRDAAFASWLDVQRGARQPQPLVGAAMATGGARQPRQRFICFQASTPSGDPTSFLETTLAHFLARGLSESLHVDIVDQDFARGRSDVTWIEIHSAPKGDDAVVVRVSVRDGPRRLLIWSDIGELPRRMILEIGQAEFLGFCNRIVRGVLDELCLRGDSERGVGEAAMMGHLSIRKLFSMKPDEMREADRLFDAANQRMPHGVFLAWRAILRSFQRIERHDGLDPARLAAETIDLSREALRLEPNNSLVLALTSNALVALGENVQSCKEIAERSVELNPANPFAWDSLSIVGLYGRDFGLANDLAVRAADIGRGAHHSFWWVTGLAIAATSLGRLDVAIRHAETAHAQAPEFRPPLRYLTALYARAGNDDKAVAAASALKQLEPGFSIDRLIEDRDYPVSMLRVGGLLDQSRLRALV